jgi:hypothetical protein
MPFLAGNQITQKYAATTQIAVIGLSSIVDHNGLRGAVAGFLAIDLHRVTSRSGAWME